MRSRSRSRRDDFAAGGTVGLHWCQRGNHSRQTHRNRGNRRQRQGYAAWAASGIAARAWRRGAPDELPALSVVVRHDGRPIFEWQIWRPRNRRSTFCRAALCRRSLRGQERTHRRARARQARARRSLHRVKSRTPDGSHTPRSTRGIHRRCPADKPGCRGTADARPGADSGAARPRWPKRGTDAQVSRQHPQNRPGGG